MESVKNKTAEKAVKKEDEIVSFERTVNMADGKSEKRIYKYRREIAERLIVKGLGRIVTVKVEPEKSIVSDEDQKEDIGKGKKSKKAESVL